VTVGTGEKEVCKYSNMTPQIPGSKFSKKPTEATFPIENINLKSYSEQKRRLWSRVPDPDPLGYVIIMGFWVRTRLKILPIRIGSGLTF
jgi:hypothetical protein